MGWPRLTDGWTADLDFILEADGVALNLAGATVTLILKTQDGREIDTVGNVSIVDAPTGRVRYAADAGDLQAKNAPYLARFKVVIGAKVLYVPNGPEDKVAVYAA